jgi:signal transduction histidine kinase
MNAWLEAVKWEAFIDHYPPIHAYFMEKVKYSNRLFSEFLDDLPLAVIWFTPVWDPLGMSIIDFKYAYANDAGIKYFNISHLRVRELLVSSSPALTDDLRKVVMDELTTAYLTGKKFETTIYNPRLDKYAKFLRFKFRGGILTFVQDITEENRFIKELEKETSFANSILDVCLNGGFAAKAIRDNEDHIVDFLIQRINPAFTQQLSLTEQEVLNKHFLSVFPSPFGAEIFDTSRRVIETEAPERFEMQYGKLWFYISCVKLGDGILVTFQDITEQKQVSEEVKRQRNLLENIFANSAAGITVIQVIRDENGTIVDGHTILANDKATELLGIPKEEYLSKKITEIDPHILSRPIFGQVLDTLKTGKPFHAEYYFEPLQKWLELSVAKLDDEHLIDIFTDNTQMKEGQVDLERSLAELKRSNENLEEFTYAASHDLKEPLRKIHYFSDRLKQRLEGKLDGEDQHFFNRIESAAQRMKLLVDDLLQYSQVTLETAPAEWVNLNKKVQLVLEDLELMIQEKQAVIMVGDLPIVKGYKRQLQQLFYNLITNALKYSKPDVPPRIDIHSQTLPGKETGLFLPQEKITKPYHVIEIRDNGIGFEQEDVERIFNVFTRLHNHGEQKGTGVGLAIVRKVVENHDGYITATGSPGEGASFKVYLPAFAQESQ